MMIVKYSGQAPRPFPHPFYGMSAHEMSGHDPYVGTFDLISLPNEILYVQEQNSLSLALYFFIKYNLKEN